jgi:Mrp family chromosome partitioning ATPase
VTAWLVVDGFERQFPTTPFPAEDADVIVVLTGDLYPQNAPQPILIDRPPMLQMPDARVVGCVADAVILVVRAGPTTRDAALAARQLLAEDNTRLLGTILNYWNPRRAGGGYYGYYGGYYDKYYRAGYYGERESEEGNDSHQ